MKSIEFQKFIDLVTFDKSLVATEKNITDVEEAIENLFASINKIQRDFNVVKDNKHNAGKAVDQKELEMKVLDDKEQDIRKKQDTITNQREYKALENELLQIQADRLGQERDLVQLWNRRETADAKYDDQHGEYEKQINDLEAQVDKAQEEIKSLQEKLDEMHKQRDSKTDGIPQEWLDMYVNMQGKVIDPVAKVVQDSCEACFYLVTNRDLQHLKKNELLQCKDCYRILYYDSPEQEEAA